MQNIIIKLFRLLSPPERKQCYLLLCMLVIMAILDTMGVASILPFMAVLSNPNIINTNEYLSYLYTQLGFREHQSFLMFLGGCFFLILISAISFKAITTYHLTRFTQMRNYTISKRMVVGYLEQPYEWFLNRHSADIGKMILSEVAQVLNGALIPLLQLLSQTLVVLFLIILLMIVDPLLTVLITLALGCAYAVIYLSTRLYIKKIGESQVLANKERYQAVQEIFGAIKEVKISGLELFSTRRYEVPAKTFANGEAMAQIISMIPKFILEIITFGGMLLVILYMMKDTGELKSALPELSLFAFAGYKLMPALQQMYAQITRMRFAKPALDVLYQDMATLNENNLTTENQTSNKKVRLSKGIVLQDVRYSYPRAEKTSLHSISLVIKANTTVGFIGASGAGKTTIIDCILGLLKPKEGKIFIDEIQLTPSKIRSWQSNIGYVPQQIYLADASVKSNIAFGVSEGDIDNQKVERAARMANLHNFVVSQLPESYNTFVGEGGVRLSGGQRQRIGIARALYNDPDVLVFDEATSALDNVTEQSVMKAISSLEHIKTIIIIAHRLSTIKKCDEIFFLDDGKLLASGGYDELEEMCPEFRAMSSHMN